MPKKPASDGRLNDAHSVRGIYRAARPLESAIKVIIGIIDAITAAGRTQTSLVEPLVMSHKRPSPYEIA